MQISVNKSLTRKAVNSCLLIALGLNLVFPGPVMGQSLFLPPVGVLSAHSPVFAPVLMLGVQTYPDQPLRFDFIMDAGDSGLTGAAFQAEADKLIRYFMASLTVPEEEMWVNLSPDERDRIIPDKFGRTRMGRDLLAQDYLLKQVTASMIYPEQELGQAFWRRIYDRVRQEYGVTNVPVDTFNKVWIVPQRADVYVNGAAAFVTGARLKVMLAADYLAARPSAGADPSASRGESPAENAVTAQIVREVIIPELEQEVNEGERFAGLRQVFWAHILATWYKRNLTQALLNQHYSDRNAVAGITDADPAEQQQIYQQYLKTFQDGIFNYIREDHDPATGAVVPRKYFAGGVQFVLGKDALRVSGQSSPVLDDWSRRAGQGDTGLIRMVRSQFRPGYPFPVSSPTGDGDAAVAEASSLSPSRARRLNIDEAWAQIREILAGENLGPRGIRTDAHKAAIRSVLKRLYREGEPGVLNNGKVFDYLLPHHRLLVMLPLLTALLEWKTPDGRGYLFSGLQAVKVAISARMGRGEDVVSLVHLLLGQGILKGEKIVLVMQSDYSEAELHEIVPVLWGNWLPSQFDILARILRAKVPAQQLLARGQVMRTIVDANPGVVDEDDWMIDGLVVPERMAAEIRALLPAGAPEIEDDASPAVMPSPGLRDFLVRLTPEHRQSFAELFLSPAEARRLSASLDLPADRPPGHGLDIKKTLAVELLADGRTPEQLTDFERHLLERLAIVEETLLPEQTRILNYQREVKLKRQLGKVFAGIEREGQRIFAGETTRTRDALAKYKRLRQDLPLLARLLAWPDATGGYLFTGPQAVSILTSFKLLPGEKKSAALIIEAINDLLARGITSGANIANILLADKRGLVPELIEAGLPTAGVMIARIVRTSAPPAQVLYYSQLWGRVMRDNPLVKFPPRLVIKAIVFAKMTGEALRRIDDQDSRQSRGARVGENWFLLELRQVLAAVSPEDAQAIRQSYTSTEQWFRPAVVTAADTPSIRQDYVGIEEMFLPVAAFLAEEPVGLTTRASEAQEQLADLLKNIRRMGDPGVLFGNSAQKYLSRYPRLRQDLPLLIKLVKWQMAEGTYLLTGLQAAEILIGFKTAVGAEEKMREVVAAIDDLLSRGVASGNNIKDILRSAKREMVPELISAGLPATGGMLGEVLRSSAPPAQVRFYGQVWGRVMQANPGVSFPAQVVAEAIELPALAAETLLPFVTDQGQAQEGRVNGFGLGGGSAAGLRRILAAVRPEDVRDLQQAYQDGQGRDWTSPPEDAVLTDPVPSIERMRANKVARQAGDLVLWNQILKDNPDAVLDESWLETILEHPEQMTIGLRRLAAVLPGQPAGIPIIAQPRYLSLETFLRSITQADILTMANHYLPADDAETFWSKIFFEMLRDRRAFTDLQSAEMPQQWDRDWPRAAPYSLLPRLVHSYHEEVRSAAREYLVKVLTTAQRDGAVVFDRDTAEQLARHPRLGEWWDRLPEALLSADPDNGGAQPSGRELSQWLESSAPPVEPASSATASSPVRAALTDGAREEKILLTRAAFGTGESTGDDPGSLSSPVPAEAEQIFTQIEELLSDEPAGKKRDPRRVAVLESVLAKIIRPGEREGVLQGTALKRLAQSRELLVVLPLLKAVLFYPQAEGGYLFTGYQSVRIALSPRRKRGEDVLGLIRFFLEHKVLLGLPIHVALQSGHSAKDLRGVVPVLVDSGVALDEVFASKVAIGQIKKYGKALGEIIRHNPDVGFERGWLTRAIISPDQVQDDLRKIFEAIRREGRLPEKMPGAENKTLGVLSSLGDEDFFPFIELYSPQSIEELKSMGGDQDRRQSESFIVNILSQRISSVFTLDWLREVVFDLLSEQAVRQIKELVDGPGGFARQDVIDIILRDLFSEHFDSARRKSFLASIGAFVPGGPVRPERGWPPLSLNEYHQARLYARSLDGQARAWGRALLWREGLLEKEFRLESLRTFKSHLKTRKGVSPTAAQIMGYFVEKQQGYPVGFIGRIVYEEDGLMLADGWDLLAAFLSDERENGRLEKEQEQAVLTAMIRAIGYPGQGVENGHLEREREETVLTAMLRAIGIPGQWSEIDDITDTVIKQLLIADEPAIQDGVRRYLYQILTTTRRRGEIVFSKSVAKKIVAQPNLSAIWPRIYDLISFQDASGAYVFRGRVLFDFARDSLKKDGALENCPLLRAKGFTQQTAYWKILLSRRANRGWEELSSFIDRLRALGIRAESAIALLVQANRPDDEIFDKTALLIGDGQSPVERAAGLSDSILALVIRTPEKMAYLFRDILALAEGERPEFNSNSDQSRLWVAWQGMNLEQQKTLLRIYSYPRADELLARYGAVAQPVRKSVSSPVGGIDMQTGGMEWNEQAGPDASPAMAPPLPDAEFWNHLPEQGLTPRILEIVPVTPAQIPQLLGVGLLASQN